jgi:hypothetical protein
MTYNDFIFKFPISGLSSALQAMQELRIIGLLGAGALPDNMLGDYRDDTGSVCDPQTGSPTWKGKQGTAAVTSTDHLSGAQIIEPAHGDPAYYYVYIRSDILPSEITFDPSAYGLVAISADEVKPVLGEWA